METEAGIRFILSDGKERCCLRFTTTRRSIHSPAARAMSGRKWRTPMAGWPGPSPVSLNPAETDMEKSSHGPRSVQPAAFYHTRFPSGFFPAGQGQYPYPYDQLRRV